MISWQREVVKLLEQAGFEVLLALFYVDDVRIILRGFNKGFWWDRAKGKFSYSEDRFRRDMQKDLLEEVRISREVLLAMNSVVGDLTFTMEVMSDFEDSTIPTLDFSLWLWSGEGVPRLSYKFFAKSMSSRYVVLETLAWAWSAKCSILAQEVQRRLQNTSRDQPLETRISILEEFHMKLARSRYSREQIRQIMEAGLKGYHSKLRRGLVHRVS